MTPGSIICKKIQYEFKTTTNKMTPTQCVRRPRNRSNDEITEKDARIKIQDRFSLELDFIGLESETSFRMKTGRRFKPTLYEFCRQLKFLNTGK